MYKMTIYKSKKELAIEVYDTIPYFKNKNEKVINEELIQNNKPSNYSLFETSVNPPEYFNQKINLFLSINKL
jgi:hypothetical protein